MIESVSKERLEELIAFHNTRAVMALAPEERRYHEDSHAAWLELLRLRDCEFVVNEMNGVAKDAARYRWLRAWNMDERISAANHVVTGAPWCVHVVIEQGVPTSVGIAGSELDAAIDSEMPSRGPAKGAE